MHAPSRSTIVLSWSEPDGAYIADVPQLPGCAADGATYQQALAAAEVVIQEWMETAQGLGDSSTIARQITHARETGASAFPCSAWERIFRPLCGHFFASPKRPF